MNLGDSYCNSDKWGGGGANTGKHTKSTDGEVPSWTAVRRKWAGIPGLKPKDLVGIPWMVAFALRADGWYLRSEIIWAKTNPMPESIKDRPTKSHEQIFLLSKQARYYYDADAIAERAVCDRIRGPALHADLVSTNGNSGLSRAVYANASSKHLAADKQSGQRRLAESVTAARQRTGDHDQPFGEKRNKRDVWQMNSQPTPDAHFATFPLELPETCILAGCPPDGLVLDPFCGAGTTGLAALKHGRRFLGIELNPEYVAISMRRLERHYSLFGQEIS